MKTREQRWLLVAFLLAVLWELWQSPTLVPVLLHLLHVH